jgi:hypothetical protein
MRARFSSLNGAVTLSVIALLTELWRALAMIADRWAREKACSSTWDRASASVCPKAYAQSESRRMVASRPRSRSFCSG